MSWPGPVWPLDTQVKMTMRAQILGYIHKLHVNMRMAGTREKRFEILEDIAVLSDILKDVTAFETRLMAELDVD